MPMSRTQKTALLGELDTTFVSAKGVVFVNYQGLKVNEIELLRRELRESKITLRVTKNTILRLAMRKHGIAYDPAILDQPLAMISGATDEVTPAKIVKKFTKEHEALEIIGGVVGGQYLAAAEVKALADLPSTLELRAKLVGVLASPLTGLVRTLQAPLAGLVSVLKQYEQSRS